MFESELWAINLRPFVCPYELTKTLETPTFLKSVLF